MRTQYGQIHVRPPASTQGATTYGSLVHGPSRYGNAMIDRSAIQATMQHLPTGPSINQGGKQVAAAQSPLERVNRRIMDALAAAEQGNATVAADMLARATTQAGKISDPTTRSEAMAVIASNREAVARILAEQGLALDTLAAGGGSSWGTWAAVGGSLLLLAGGGLYLAKRRKGRKRRKRGRK